MDAYSQKEDDARYLLNAVKDEGRIDPQDEAAALEKLLRLPEQELHRLRFFTEIEKRFKFPRLDLFSMRPPEWIIHVGWEGVMKTLAN